MPPSNKEANLPGEFPSTILYDELTEVFQRELNHGNPQLCLRLIQYYRDHASGLAGISDAFRESVPCASSKHLHFVANTIERMYNEIRQDENVCLLSLETVRSLPQRLGLLARFKDTSTLPKLVAATQLALIRKPPLTTRDLRWEVRRYFTTCRMFGSLD